MTDANPEALHDDHDSAWKEALSRRFPEFLALLFPEIHAGVDWSRGHDFLDKELQQIVHDAETGRRYADKLVKVFTREGVETWVLIHVEVQGEPEADFAERMFVYHYRLRDRYAVPVVSLAVLADTVSSYRPDRYQDTRWGCEVLLRFPTVKLLDWATGERWQDLEASDNVFALVVMAQIQAKATRDVEKRKAWKLRLSRSMYERGYSRDVILELFQVIHWMIRLPRGMEALFRQEIYQFEESMKMPYAMTLEQEGIEKGLQQGRREGEAAILLRQIELKFGETAAAAYRDRIDQADAEILLTWSERILTAGQVETIFD